MHIRFGKFLMPADGGGDESHQTATGGAGGTSPSDDVLKDILNVQMAKGFICSGHQCWSP